MTPHLTPAQLVDYLAGDTSDEAEQVEEHLFECRTCAQRAAELEACAAAVATLFGLGKAGVVATDSLLRLMEERGVPVRHYHAEPGGRIECTVGPQDVFVAAHYEANFASVAQVEVEVDDEAGRSLIRMDDVPVPPGATSLPVLIRADFLRKQPSGAHHVTVRSGERLLAQYIFAHSAQGE